MSVRDAYFPLVITFLILDGIVVGLRFVARRSKGAPGYDDFAMLLSLLGFVVFGAMELAAVHYGIGATAMDPSFDFEKAAKYFTVGSVVYILASGVSKVGVGLVLLRLCKSSSNMTRVRHLIMGCTVLTALWFLAGALVFALQCQPLSKAWDLTGVAPGTCMPVSTIGTAGIVISAGDVFFTTVFALAPIYMFWQVNISLKLKLSVCILLGLGLVSAVMTIIRLKFVVIVAEMSSRDGIAGPEVIGLTLEATLYSVLEIATSILAAAMTALRPMLAKLPCFSSLGSGGNSRSTYSGPTFGQGDSALGIRAAGPGYRLDDMATDVSKSDSQEYIVRHGAGGGVTKNTQFDISYEPAAKGKTKPAADW